MTANIGHGVSKIADVMHDQAQTIGFSMYAQFSNAPAEAWAKRLTALAPADIDHVFFVNSGSEAAEYAMRLALQVCKERGQPGKTMMLSRETSYHGMTMGALSVSGQDARRADFGDYLHAFPAVPAAYAYRSDWGDLPEDQQWVAADDWEKAILAAGPDKVAAIIAVPIVGAAGGALVAPKGVFPPFARNLRSV
jgi:adenosylmethionine-8-amino-7-oxononanoate aminotransferase